MRFAWPKNTELRAEVAILKALAGQMHELVEQNLEPGRHTVELLAKGPIARAKVLERMGSERGATLVSV